MRAFCVTLVAVVLAFNITSAAYTSWLDRDNAGGVGDFETYVDFTTPPCSGTPTKIQVRVRGTSQIIISTDERLTVGPDYGLSCVNNQQGDNYCRDYRVRYVNPLTSVWFDRDNAGGSGDWELKSLETGSQWKAGSKLEWLTASAQCYGVNVEQRLTVGPAYGLSCVNSQQTSGTYCKDYEVRFDCP